MSIYEFEPGDIITRMLPSKPISVIADETVVDRNYIGEELLFVGIANGCVNVEPAHPKTHDILRVIMSSPLINLPLDAYDEGWSYYVDPYSILFQEENDKPAKSDKLPKKSLPKETVESLKLKMQIAIDNQEFEKAENIKKEIEKINNSK